MYLYQFSSEGEKLLTTLYFLAAQETRRIHESGQKERTINVMVKARVVSNPVSLTRTPLDQIKNGKSGRRFQIFRFRFFAV